MNIPVVTADWQNNFKFPHDIALDINGYYISRGHYTNSYFEEPYWTVDVKLQKSFLKDNLIVQLFASDIFETGAFNSTQYCGNRYLTSKSLGYRKIGLQLRYKFNATQSKYRGTGAGQSAKSRMK